MELSKFQVTLLFCALAPPFLVYSIHEQSRRQQIMAMRPFELPGTVTLFHTTSFCGCERVLAAAQNLQNKGFRIKLVDINTHQQDAELNKIRYSPTYIYYRDGKEQKRIEDRLYEEELESLLRGLH
ncbi:MAG: thioredoxin family protein [Pirellula sp.]